MAKNTSQNDQDKVEAIHNIYTLFVSKLNQLRKKKYTLIQNISKRLSNKKADEILKDLKEKY